MKFRFTVILLLLIAGCESTDTGTTPVENAGCAPWPAGLMVGTALSDELLDVIIDERGNLYLAGYEGGTTGTTTIDPAGNARGFVLKYDRMGMPRDKLTLETTGASTVEALALDRQTGELFLAGRTNGALAGYNNAGQFDLLVGWLHREEWLPRLAQFGNARPQHPRRLALGLSNEIVVAGYEDIYVPTNYVEAWENPLLAKFSRNNGTVVETWNREFTTPSSDAFGGLAVAPDGAVYVTGHSSDPVEKGLFITKYDSQGATLWHRQITGIVYDSGAALHLLPDGNLLLAGSSFALLGETGYGQMDIIVQKIDSATGEPLWTTQYGSAETDWVTDMTVDANGRIYVVGETLGSLEEGKTNPDANAIFLTKFDPAGTLLLARQWNSSGFETPTAVTVDACERAFVVGYTTGNLLGQSNGGRDGFILPVFTRQ